MKKVIGIISIVLFFVVGFQSCAAGLGNAIANNGESSGSAGIFLGLCLLIGGIILLCSKNHKGMVITTIVFYGIGALIGAANVGSYKDLAIWAGLSVLFDVLLIIHLVKNKELYSKDKKIEK